MTSLRHIIPLLFTGLLFYSCVKEPFDKSAEEDPADKSLARITLAVTGDTYAQENREQQDEANQAAYPHLFALPQSKASQTADEEKISNLHILIFDSKGAIVSNIYRSGLNLTQANTITLDTRPGTGMQIYAIANGDVNDSNTSESNPALNTQLTNITSIEQFKELLVKVNGNGLQRNDRLTMVGNATVNISNPHTQQIPLKMKYLAAKVTVNVAYEKKANSDLDIEITGWDMVNIPVKTYLFERPMAGGSYTHDAVSGSNQNDYISTDTPAAFEPVGTSGKAWTQTFYLFENRRGGRVERADAGDPTEKYPGMNISDSDPRGKAWWAPAGATYMLVYGTARQNRHTNKVVYKIYLGENVFNDYNSARGKYYTFNVKITGINEIDIDSSVDWGNSCFTVTPYGDLTKMDAHPDFRVLRISATAVDADISGYVTVEVLNNDDTPCQWLSLSALNLYRHGIKQQGNQNQPFDDAVGYFVRTKYNPTIFEELSFDRATFGMARKLTEIPFAQLAVFTSQDVIIYADEFNGLGERNAKVRVTYYDAQSTPSVLGQLEFAIAQQDAIKISDNLYVERYEEYAMRLQPPDIPYIAQAKWGMQWGYKGTMFDNTDNRFVNGNYLTANTVYNNVDARNGMNAPQWEVTTHAAYREKYTAMNSKVTEPQTTMATSGMPYYYPQLTSTTTDYYDPTYNSSAAHYCHEKNRDSNGDGIISKEETVWYLPSYCDMDSIIEKAVIPGADYYWSATEANANESFAFMISNGITFAKDKTSIYRVRCVRGTGVATMKIPSITNNSYEFTAASSTKQTISITGDKYYGRWTLTSSDPTWLKIAPNVTSGTGTASLSGIGFGAVYLHVEENNTGRNRAATVTFKHGDKVLTTITVSQRGIPLLTVDKTSFSLPFIAEESRGFNITAPTTDKWTATSDQSWLNLSTSVAGAVSGAREKTGTSSQRLYIFTTSSNPSTSAVRKAKVTISRTGMQPVVIEVTQGKKGVYEPAQHSGWASSNIFYFTMTSALFFTEGPLSTSSEYQGLLFYWGSLVATSPVYTRYNPDIIHSPAGVSGYPKAIAYANTAVNRNQHHILEQHNPSAGIGDICRYMTARGMAPGSNLGRKWRLPTCAEFEADILKIPISTVYALQYPTDKYGTERILKGSLVDPGKLCLPASGWFGYNGGSDKNGWYAGYCGVYASGTSSVDLGVGVALHYNTELGTSPFVYGIPVASERASVRCVVESKTYD